jgi:aquaporin Z
MSMTTPMRDQRPVARPGGWQIGAYLAEFAGTALILVVGLSAVTTDFGSTSPVPRHIASAALRRLITGSIFATAGALVVYSKLGRRSGGHFNPAVTLAFYRLGKVTKRDAVVYVLCQALGALVGAAVVWAVWGALARSVRVGATVPGSHGAPVAFLAEIGMAFLLLTVILQFVTHMVMARFTPVAAGAVAALLVVLVAPISGTSINPARSFGPALFGHELGVFWVYLVAPPLGALLAVALYRALGRHSTPCAKLYHTDDYACHFVDCAYQPPHRARETEERSQS